MAEELENKERDEAQETPESTEAPGEGSNNVPTPDELTVLKAQLEDEHQVLADAQAQLTERDDRIAALQEELNQEKSQRELTLADLHDVKESHDAAVAKYLEAVKAANPLLPGDVIAGESIDQIDRSLATALAIAGAVQANLAAEAQNNRVPAGAPTRTVNLEGLTPDELIRLGLSQS